MANLNKRLLLCFISMVSLLFFSSCFEKNNYHYPEYVYFPKEGGKMRVHGDKCFYGLSIEDGCESVAYMREDSTVMSYKWLTVIAEPQEENIKIIVAPSDLKKKRKLRILGYYGREYAEINVIQEGN